MQMEQALATALVALQDPTILASSTEDDAQFLARKYRASLTQIAERPSPARTQFRVNGRYGRAGSDVERAYIRDCHNFSKVFPGYPQTARVTISLQISL